MKCEELGRSMIEMLGVLAIVGVLSVGGIAGYSKAMKKYKYNKLASEFTMFIQELYNYKSDLAKEKERLSPDEHMAIASYIEGMGILPAGWKRQNHIIVDSMGNRINPFIRNTPGRLDYGLISLDYSLLSDTADDLCIFMFSNIIFNSTDWLVSAGAYGQNSADGSHSSTGWYGNTYCGNGRRCIKDMTMADVLNVCHFCSEEQDGCVLVLKY
ncbi:MAG: hypothetical protein NC218_05340 [Acetobacter sp.]|nr:hypothetical protein [Acetobacter sp.]